MAAIRQPGGGIRKKNKFTTTSSGAETDAAIDAFGKNEHVKKIFWSVFVAVAGLAITRVLDPATAQQLVHIISGIAI